MAFLINLEVDVTKGAGVMPRELPGVIMEFENLDILDGVDII
jgi:hypothetical protein